MWECEWRQIQATDQTARNFLQTTRMPHCSKTKMSQREVIEAVMDGSMFGLVECDIQVPEAMRDQFAEMPPIFKNVDISRVDIGEHMRSYAEREGIMKTPRRSLIGSMFGNRILLTTPLLQWYLKSRASVSRRSVMRWVTRGELEIRTQLKPSWPIPWSSWGTLPTGRRSPARSDTWMFVCATIEMLLGTSTNLISVHCMRWMMTCTKWAWLSRWSGSTCLYKSASSSISSPNCDFLLKVCPPVRLPDVRDGHRLCLSRHLGEYLRRCHQGGDERAVREREAPVVSSGRNRCSPRVRQADSWVVQSRVGTKWHYCSLQQDLLLLRVEEQDQLQRAQQDKQRHYQATVHGSVNITGS